MSIYVATPDGHTAEFPDGTDPSVIQAAMAKTFGGPGDKTGPAAFNPTNGMGTADKLLAGVGQGMTDAPLGAAQFMAHSPIGGIAQQITSALGGPNVQGGLDQAAKDKAALDQPLMDTGAGKVGGVVGNMAALAPVGAVAAPSMGSGILAKLGQLAAGGAIQGGAAGLVQPVTGDNYAADKLGQVGTGAVVGGAVNPALSVVGKVIQAALPQNAVGSVMNALGSSAAKTPFAAEGEALAGRTGIDLTPAQITGGKAQTQLENLARQSIFSRNDAFAADQKIAQQWTDYVGKMLDNVSNGGGSPAEVGQRVQGAVKAAVSDMTQARNTAANVDYGAIRSLTRGAAIIEPQATNDALKTIVSDYSGVGTPSADAIARFAQRQLSNVAPASAPNLTAGEQMIKAMVERAAPNDRAAFLDSLAKGSNDPIMPQAIERVKLALDPATAKTNPATAPAQGNLDKLMQLRSYLSKVAGGEASISGENVDRKLATGLLSTIDQDLNSGAQQIGGPIGEMLQQANSRYRAASQQIEGLQNSALGKLVGQDFVEALGNGTFNQIPGEVVMQRIAAMKPSQLESVKGVLQDVNPDAWQSVKRSVLEDALTKAQAAAPSEGANAIAARPGVFVNAIAKTSEDQAKLASIFEPQERAQIDDAIAAAKRISDRTGTNFSGTAAAAEGYGVMRALGSALYGNLAPAAGLAGQAMSMKSVAAIMANSEGRATIQQLARLPAGSERFRELSAKLASIVAAGSVNPPTDASQ